MGVVTDPSRESSVVHRLVERRSTSWFGVVEGSPVRASIDLVFDDESTVVAEFVSHPSTTLRTVFYNRHYQIYRVVRLKDTVLSEMIEETDEESEDAHRREPRRRSPEPDRESENACPEDSVERIVWRTVSMPRVRTRTCRRQGEDAVGEGHNENL